MRLYIPTCTLNFNNIFSSESISPFGFYARRGFGNKRFYPVCANRIDNAILLYSKYPRYKVDDSDLENYPMVIEIETEDYKEGFFDKVTESNGIVIYSCYHTININPFHCKIYFDSNQEIQGVLSKAEQSIENKFYRLYSNCIEVKSKVKKSLSNSNKDFFVQSERDDFDWSESLCSFESKSKEYDCDADASMDRIKGFLYCYLIGANNSVSSEVGKLKSLSRKLRNTLSAVVNSPDHKPTQSQDETLLNGIKVFNAIYSSIDEGTIYNKKVLKEKLEDNLIGLSAEKCEKLLRHWGVYDDFCRKLRLRRVYDANDLWTCLEYPSQDSLSRAIESMSTAVRRLEHTDIDNSPKSAIDDLADVKDAHVIIKDNSFIHTFYGRLIASQITADYRNVMAENGAEEPLAQAYNGGKILRDLLGEKWDSNPASKYVQSLLNHFQENTSFNLLEIDSEVLVSFAAFCQKGDNIERLKEYLIQMGICNYRLAFGIYGATRGFASLPKTFTSNLINGNREYYQKVALSMWKMLNGVDLGELSLPSAKAPTSILKQSKIGSPTIEKINKVEPKASKQPNVGKAVSKAIEQEDSARSPKAFMKILECFPRMKATKAFKALETAKIAEKEDSYTPTQIYTIIGEKALKGQKDKIDKAMELEAKRKDPKAYQNILRNMELPVSVKKKMQTIVMESSTLQHEEPSPITYASSQDAGERRLGPFAPTSNQFIDDNNACHFIFSKSYIHENLRETLFNKVLSFQKKYAPGEKYYSDPKYPRDNKSTISHFKNWCFYDKGKYPPIVKKTTENMQMLERLTQDLLARYDNR